MNSYVHNVKQSIKHGQIKKAEELLYSFPNASKNEQMEIINKIAIVSDDTAWNLLKAIVSLNLKRLSIEASVYKSLIELIIDRAHLNFKFLLILYDMGDAEYIRQAIPLMEYVLSKETDIKILVETIKTAGNQRIEHLVRLIADFIYYDDKTLKEAAVLALAEISTPKAVQYLSQASGTVKNDQNIMDAIALLKFERQKNIKEEARTDPWDIRNYLIHLGTLRSSNVYERHRAFLYFLKTGQKHASKLALNLKTDEKNLIINILKIFGSTLPTNILPEIVKLLNTEKPDIDIQLEAFKAISCFKPKDLHPFDLTEIIIKALDKNPSHLRIAAASALNRTNNQKMFDIIKNKIETGRAKGENLTHTLIDARAENIINYLLVSDTFTYMASNYLAGNIPPASLNKYITVLNKRGLRATAMRILASAHPVKENESKPEAVIISTSTTAINVYEKLMFSSGYDVLSFNSPQEAFEHASTTKPAMILSNLFIGSMTAIEFALEIREFYSKKELPIIIFTNQTDLIGIDIENEYPHAGLNKILKFPGTPKQITAALSQGI